MLTTNSDGVPVLESQGMVRRRFIMTLGFFGLVGLVIALLFNSGSSDKLIGAGSTFAQPLVQRLAQDYLTSQAGGSDWSASSASVDYEAVGSLGGIMRLRDVEVDFALADYPLSEAALKDVDSFQFPIAVGSISPAYNLGSRVSSPLKLSPDLLAAIFTGQVKTWNDARIVAENSDVVLPDLAIQVVFRSDGSGTTQNFTEFLSSSVKGWKDSVGSGVEVKWPVGTGMKGSSKVAEQVTKTEGAIGYLETGQAKRAGLKVAAVRNAAGQYVLPERAAVLAASQTLAIASGSVASLTSADAYPLVAVVYAVVKTGENIRSDREAALRFFNFLFSEGAGRIEELGYLPLPQNLTADIIQQWKTRFGQGKAS